MRDASRSGLGAAGRTRARRRAGLAALVVASLAAGCGGAGGQAGSPTVAPSPSVAATSPAPATPAATPTPTPTPVPTPIPTPPTGPITWTLAWSDEFDGPAGTPPDPATWGYDLGDGSVVGLTGWGNNELQSYTASPENAAMDGEGNLVITVRRADGSERCYYGPCEYTSARLLTRDRYEFQYGRIEARIKVPGASGLWPAFWMLGNDLEQVGWPESGEIDIMEFVGRRPNEVLGTIHGPGYSGSSGFTGAVDLGKPVADDFHTFSIDWWPGAITWRLDGEVFHEARPSDVAPNRWVFDHPFFMILNVAVGGNLGGPVAADIPLPQSMVVDYVRLYREATP
jgi:beta-glucanase (GH16 family)